MPCCCVVGCHNRAEKGYKLYKLPQGAMNNARRKLWIQNIARKDPLPQHAYVCQDHFTDDQFELRRADNKRLLRWNAVPTIFPHCKAIRLKTSSKKEAVISVPKSNKSEAAIKENLKLELKVKAESHGNTKKHLDEVTALKSELNASQKEIHTLKTIIYRLQAIIERLVEQNDEIDKMQKNSM